VALVYEDGRGVENPIATCELQGYVYVAKQQYAVAIGMGLHKFGQARRLLREASQLRRKFDDVFWMEPEGFIPLALDREKRPVRSISSNPGHCLATGIVSGERARRVAERLMAPDMFSGWGIRTLSSEHPSFNPFSYQLGSVWPVETATIAFGMKRYGFHDLCNELARASFAAAGLFPHHRLPEVLGGDDRDEEHPHPGVYPQAESPQAWSASSIPLLIQAMLGLRPIAPLSVLLIDPVLPEWLPRLSLRELRVGSATVSLEFHRTRDGGTSWNVTEKRGPLRVVQQAPESSPQAGWLQRGRDAVRSFVPAAH
jgi:glycogen debranching enzyme